jgi:hypothetical protein
MMMIKTSPTVRDRTSLTPAKRKKELIQAHIRGLVSGINAAAKAAKLMAAEGWTDMDKFEAEVWRRVRGWKR